MSSLRTQDGQLFVKSLASFIRQHEKALANSLQLSLQRRPSSNDVRSSPSPVSPTVSSATPSQSHSSLMSAFAHAGLNFAAQAAKSAHLTLTPHHLFYLLSQIEDLGISVGPMNVRIESLHHELTQSNYVSFLQAPKVPRKGRDDAESMHSVSSVRSVASLMGGFWSSIGLGSVNSKTEKAKAAYEADLTYLYSAFTKLPSLRLTADHRAQLIHGYEEFPFDTAVPLFVFKNAQQLDIIDLDFRQFHGWDRLAEQLTLLTVKRGNLDDVEDLLTNIVLDDAEKRRRRSTRNISEAPSTPSWTVPSTPPTPHPLHARPVIDSGSPPDSVPTDDTLLQNQSGPPSDLDKGNTVMPGSTVHSSPRRPNTARPASSYRHARSYSSKIKRSGSGSSNSSDYCATPQRTESLTNFSGSYSLPPSKWQRLKYLSLADNGLTNISARGIAPVASSLRSLNLSSNLFNEVPDSLVTLTRLTSLDLSNCLIDSLLSLSRQPLPAISTLKLKSNRLLSLTGIERLVSLENLHVQDNLLTDPMEAARLTGMPNLKRIWVKHNPLTKQYSNYRLTIFNLFRQTPGYVDDIIIDDHSPSYAERKALIARVAEVERPLSGLASRVAETPVVVQHVRPVDSNATATSSAEALRETAYNSSRRRRGPRRRIVDLTARDERSDADIKPDRSLVIDTQVHQAADDDEGHELATATSPTATVHQAEGVPPPTQLGDPAPAEIDHQHADYRARIEALRHEFGNTWLSALGNQGPPAEYPYTTETSQSHLPLAHTPVVVSPGRSLG